MSLLAPRTSINLFACHIGTLNSLRRQGKVRVSKLMTRCRCLWLVGSGAHGPRSVPQRVTLARRRGGCAGVRASSELYDDRAAASTQIGGWPPRLR
jgi:hypothetical protein